MKMELEIKGGELSENSQYFLILCQPWDIRIMYKMASFSVSVGYFFLMTKISWIFR